MNYGEGLDYIKMDSEKETVRLTAYCSYSRKWSLESKGGKERKFFSLWILKGLLTLSIERSLS